MNASKRIIPWKLITASFAALLLISAFATASASADSNGQAIGQDELRKALTICSNAGVGNGGEFENSLGVSVNSDCFEKRFLSRYSSDQVAAILDQSGCSVVGPVFGLYFFSCEIDPGNSADHNQAQNNADKPQSEAAQ